VKAKQTAIEAERKALAFALVLASVLTLIPAGFGQIDNLAFAEDGANGSSHGVGVKAASWALTVPYCLVKAVYAVTGGIVGGFTYALSGGNTDAAKAVWTSSIGGTYVIKPEHLKGQEPLQFVGKAEDS
jgi:hypothetical protein